VHPFTACIFMSPYSPHSQRPTFSRARVPPPAPCPDFALPLFFFPKCWFSDGPGWGDSQLAPDGQSIPFQLLRLLPRQVLLDGPPSSQSVDLHFLSPAPTATSLTSSSEYIISSQSVVLIFPADLEVFSLSFAFFHFQTWRLRLRLRISEPFVIEKFAFLSS